MKKKIAFYIESMVVGGAEKVLIDLVNNLDSAKYDVTVVSIFKKSVYSGYKFKFKESFASNIKFKYLINNENKIIYYLFNFLYNKLSKQKIYKTLVKERYDIEIAFYEGLPTQFISYSNQKSHKIAWLHTNQKRIYEKASSDEKGESRKIYEKFNKIFGVSDAVCTSFSEVFPHLNPMRIYNPFGINLIRDKSNLKFINLRYENTINFITVGRLTEIKGYERLIKSLASCKKLGYKFSLLMIGDGHQDAYLKNMVFENNLQNDIHFLGHIDNPYPYMKNADCFICSSYEEGLSTVVIESIILGTPILTTSCSGMNEIIADTGCGVICENSEKGIESSLLSILSDTSQLQQMKIKSKGSGERFSVERFLKEFDQYILENI